MTSQEEARLISQAAGGDADAFEQLMTFHQKTVYNLALRMVGNADDAFDMSQETFLKAWNALPEFRGGSKFSVWLYRLTTNVCIDHLRAVGRRPAVSLQTENEAGEEVELEIPDERFSPEKLLEKRELRDAVRRGMASLPEDYRRALALREVSGLSYEEIAEATHTDLGTVKSRIFRARKKLCEFLLKDGNFSASSPSNTAEGGVKRG